MNSYEITRQLIKARAAERAVYKALEAVEGVEGMDITGLLTTRRELGERIAELEAQRAEVREAEEKARRAKAKTVKVRRHEWDEDSTVEVHLVPAEHSDAEWEVIYQTRHIGRVGSYAAKQRKQWHVQTPRSRSVYASPLYGLASRADAIRYLLAAETGL